MALYILHSIFHLARLLYVRPETFGPYYVRILLMCIRSYLKTVVTFKFLIFDTYHTDTLCVREQGCEDTCLFFEARRGP